SGLAVARVAADPALRPTRRQLAQHSVVFAGMAALAAFGFGQHYPGLMLVPLVGAMLAGLWTNAAVALSLPLAIALAGGVQT
ncbi:hypothetical protein ABTB83_19745, partial [Acinetobacter baumannii]